MKKPVRFVLFILIITTIVLIYLNSAKNNKIIELTPAQNQPLTENTEEPKPQMVVQNSNSKPSNDKTEPNIINNETPPLKEANEDIAKPEPNNLELYEAEDFNQNALWDDVEQKIELRWSKNHPNVRAAAKQMALALQDTLNETIPLKVRDKALGESLACFLAIEREYSPDWTKTNYTKELRDIVLSKESRNNLYIKYNSELNGQVISVPTSSSFYCKFKKG